MPSPFPGMDPYVENPRIWPNAHHRLITACGDRLGARLRPRYYVGIEERAYLIESDDPAHDVIVPDLQIVEPIESWSNWSRDDGGMSVAIAEPIVTKTLIDTEIHEPLIEILDAQSREVITVIEILSPSNKILGAAGRESYLRKRIEVLKSKTHLVEIDLLRVGRGFLSTGKLRGVNYSVHVSRAGRRPEGMLWKIRLPQKLPVISIPLKAGDDDVPLDLQEVFASVYDLAGFDLVIDYRGQTEPGLDENQAKWADQLLKSNGLR